MYDLTLELETWFKVTAYPFLTSSVYVMYEPNRTKWIIFMLWKNFCMFQMTLTYLFKVTTHLLTIGNLCVKYEPECTKGREDELRTRAFHINLIWRKLLTYKIAYSLINGTLWVKHEPHLAKWERRYVLDKRFWTDKRSEGRMDGRIDHYRAPADQGLNYNGKSLRKKLK